MKRLSPLAVLAPLVVWLASEVARADVFSMPGGQTSLTFATVGDPGNPADPNTGSIYGAVPYVYQMGQYDVTVGQYVQFLNAVAATDTYGLYNHFMATDFPTISIVQNGSPGSYTYSVGGSYGQAANCPVFDVSWGDAARFSNWLDNGQPAGPEGSGTTETGSYTLNGAVTESALMAITRNSGAKYFIPTESEWYKAAYYSGVGSTYYTYATSSDTAPGNTLSAILPNQANHYIDGYTDPTNYLTPVGAFAASPSPWGTYDQSGDVFDWNETDIGGSSRGLRGGAFGDDSSRLSSSGRLNFDPTSEDFGLGFRVASVPEPGGVALACCALGVLLASSRRFRAFLFSFPLLPFASASGRR